MVQMMKRIKITCSRNPAITRVFSQREDVDGHRCHICHQEQHVIGKGNCMTVRILPANESVEKRGGKATKGFPYHRESAFNPAEVVEHIRATSDQHIRELAEAVTEMNMPPEKNVKKKGRFGKRSTKSKVRYAHV